MRVAGADGGAAGRDGDDALGRVLEALWREWDRQQKLTGDERDRAEHVGLDAARRESELARRENQRLRRLPEPARGLVG